MEDLCNRVPLISKSICKELDHVSLVKFKETSREINKNLKSERFYWINVLRAYNCFHGDFKDFWVKVVKRTPVEFVKEIVIIIDQFYIGIQDDGAEDDEKIITHLICGIYNKQVISFSPQHIAAYSGRVDSYKHFVERTRDINPKEQHSDLTPMHFAAGNGKLEVCQFIIDNLDDKNPRDKFDVTPLHSAASCGHLEFCKLIIENVQDKNPGNNIGETPLHLAAHEGHLDICRLIIQNVQNKNPEADHGFTPLHEVASSSHLIFPN